MQLIKPGLLFLSLAAFTTGSPAQNAASPEILTHADTLRGSNGPFRQKWDVLHYEITVKPDYNTKTISGKNIISFFDSGADLMQIDLQEPMVLDSVLNEAGSYPFRREGNVYWVMFRDSTARFKITPGIRELAFFFHGKPKEAVKPPWDGGWIWKKDKNGNPWMTVACQGLGASVWYPCKDIQSDRPDSGAVLHIITPDSLVAVGNGRLTAEANAGAGFRMYTWTVTNPINNYCIVPYIGKYVSFADQYPGLKGNLDMTYWVLDYDLAKAKKQFTDAPKMMKAFEYWFGPYPFYEDGYQLIEAPHLGMEHQSAIAYGNQFKQGYLGRDLSGSGEGLKWDFIIVHESGHEWFANSICAKDIADMWIHEGFTDYSETLFTEYYWGKAAADAYVQGLRQNIVNDVPIIGLYGVNKEGSGDMYYKGANMLHLIRQITNNDDKFRAMLLGINKTFYHQAVTTQQVEDYVSAALGLDLKGIFDQYLRSVMIPQLNYKISGRTISYSWVNTVPGLQMPIKIYLDSTGRRAIWITPGTNRKTFKAGKGYDGQTFNVDPNFYILKNKLL